MKTDVNEFVTDLECGTFEQKLGSVLSDVAAACSDYDKKGEVTIKLKFRKISNAQINITHELQYNRPTGKGTLRENTSSNTVFHVGKGGKMTLLPDTQTDFFKDKKTTAKQD